MSKELTVITEQVDDIPLLINLGQRLGIAELMDEHYSAHGNWQGLSPGFTTMVWLAYILSEADHRLSHVRPWVAKSLEMLQVCVGQAVGELAFIDDRLGLISGALGEDLGWIKFEVALNAHTLQVYDLKRKPRPVVRKVTT